MEDFNKWFDELKSNSLWWMRMNELYGKKNLSRVAGDVHLYLLASINRLKANDFQDFRRLFQSFAQKAEDAPVRPQLQQVEDNKPMVSDPVVEGEARDQWIAIWKESVEKCQMISSVPRLSAKQIIEEGDWRAVSTMEPRDEFQKRLALEEHKEKVAKARELMFRKAYPDASEEEVQAYIDKFDTI